MDSRNSIFKRVVVSLVAVMTLAILIVEVTNMYVIYKDGIRAQELFEQTIDTYGSYWESRLDATTKSILNLTSIENGTEFEQLCLNDDKLETEIAKLQLRDKLTDMCTRYNQEITSFVYVPDKNIYFGVYEENTDYNMKESINERIRKYIDSGEYEDWKSWYVIDVEDVSYLIRTYHLDNGYIGVMYKVSNILNGLYNREDDWQLNAVDENDHILLQHGDIQKGRIVSYTYHLKNTQLYINTLIPSSSIWNNSGLRMLILIGAVLVAAMLIGLVIGFQSRLVFNPLEQLRLAMESYSQGNLGKRLPKLNGNSQISQLYQTYNDMADQIQNLKIQVYEKELEKQRINSDFLKIQIQPHFYTNIMNLIYGLAQMKDYASVQKLSLACGRYFRYLLGRKGTFVPLEEELRCLESYIEIQKCRYQDKFQAEIQMEPGLENQLVLPLAVQTFLANSVKHNIARVPILNVYVKIEKTNDKKICIVVRDNGVGIEENILKKLEKKESIEKNGEHIGIQNILERIKTCYEQEADIQIRSCHTGTEVTLFLPVLLDDEVEEA